MFGPECSSEPSMSLSPALIRSSPGVCSAFSLGRNGNIETAGVDQRAGVDALPRRSSEEDYEKLRESAKFKRSAKLAKSAMITRSAKLTTWATWARWSRTLQRSPLPLSPSSKATRANLIFVQILSNAYISCKHAQWHIQWNVYICSGLFVHIF